MKVQLRVERIKNHLKNDEGTSLTSVDFKPSKNLLKFHTDGFQCWVKQKQRFITWQKKRLPESRKILKSGEGLELILEKSEQIVVNNKL